MNMHVALDVRAVESCLVCEARRIPAPEMEEEAKDLRSLILGPPIADVRRRRRVGALLEAHLEALAVYVCARYGNTDAARQAAHKIRQVARQPGTSPVVLAAKRALLLLAVMHEGAVRDYFGSDYARDCSVRVLPFLMPRFIQNFGTDPVDLVESVSIWTEMFPESRTGSYPT